MKEYLYKKLEENYNEEDQETTLDVIHKYLDEDFEDETQNSIED